MIVKFDHISYSCKIGEIPENLLVGYEPEFMETGLPNIAAKKMFFQEQWSHHDIALYRSEGKYPIEITAYPGIIGENQKFSLSEDEIVVYSQDVEATVAFYEAIGFKKGEQQTLELLPFMEKKKVILRVQRGDEEQVFLDKKGFGSLAFVVDRIEKHKAQLEKKNFTVTDIEVLSVNGKELKICFATNNIGDIVEFIGIR